MKILRHFIYGCLFFVLTGPSLRSAPDDKKQNIPRFASIRSTEVNLRRGPGKQYPCDWTYIQSGYPIEIIAEYGTWRMTRDHEGVEGWIHQAMLSGQRSVITLAETKFYHSADATPDSVQAILEKNVIAKVIECTPEICKVYIANLKGWIKRKDLWGIKNHEFKFK